MHCLGAATRNRKEVSQQLELRIHTPTLGDVTLPDLWIGSRREWLAPNEY